MLDVEKKSKSLTFVTKVSLHKKDEKERLSTLRLKNSNPHARKKND